MDQNSIELIEKTIEQVKNIPFTDLNTFKAQIQLIQSLTSTNESVEIQNLFEEFRSELEFYSEEIINLREEFAEKLGQYLNTRK